MNKSYIDLANIKRKYPNLKYDDSLNLLKGKIDICKNCRDEVIKGEYDILIDFKNHILPFVYDTGHSIRKSYPHKYNDNHLCLATDIEQILFLKEYKKISLWIEKYIETYFITYEYFEKYGIYPFGEYSHGYLGIKEFYLNYFNITAENNADNILKYILFKNYRGHDLCPCGNQVHLRKCHGQFIIKCKNDKNFELLKQYYMEVTNEK